MYENNNDDNELTAYLVENNNQDKMSSNNNQRNKKTKIVYGKKIAKSKRVYPLKQLPEDGQVVVEGEIFEIDDKETRNGR